MSKRISVYDPGVDRDLAAYISRQRKLKEHPNEDPLFNRKSAALYLSFAPGTLANWPKEKLPYVKIGRSVRYRKSDLDRFLERSITPD